MREGAATANRGRSWLSSEPVHFFAGLEDGKLAGASKPNFIPSSDDAKSATSSGLPDGTPRDVVEILSRLSREHGVDWEVSHDFGAAGFIRAGVPDRGCSIRLTRSQISATHWASWKAKSSRSRPCNGRDARRRPCGSTLCQMPARPVPGRKVYAGGTHGEGSTSRGSRQRSQCPGTSQDHTVLPGGKQRQGVRS